jgi:outer membrane protein
MRIASVAQPRSFIALIALALITSIVLLAFSASAQDGASEDAVAAANAAEMETAPDSSDDALQLSLREAVDLAIENNLGVEIERHAPLIASEDLEIAWGAYDPTLTSSLEYSSRRSAAGANSFDPNQAEVKSTTGTASLGGLVPYLGARLTLDYTTSKISNVPTERFSPKYESGLALTANIPLLKNLVWNDPWTQVEIAGVVHASAQEQFRTVLMDTVQQTIGAYWTLVAEAEQLRVARKSFQTGVALREQTQTQYEVGVKSKVEVIQAEAGVAARELDVIRAEASFQNSQDRLIDLVYGVRLTPDVVLNVIATDKPADFDEHQMDPTHAAELAMENRPELASLENEIERYETLVRFRKNQRLPELDLNLTYGTSGIEGKGNENNLFIPDPLPGQPRAVPEGTGGTYAETHDNWFAKRGAREYSVGGSFSIPLGNYGPRHSVSKARFELRRAKTQLIQLHQRIILEVRRDIRLLDAARKGIYASERQRVAAEEQLRAERIRLEHGESTPFDVLQKESDLVEAEVAKIEALQLYRTSASALDRSQGTILRTHNIVVGSVGGLRNGMERESFAVRDLLNPILP